MSLKIARIVDFCGKSSGLADFENTVERGSAVIFDTDSGLCQNFDHRSFFSLGRNINEVIQIISFSKEALLNSGVTLLLVLCCVLLIKHVVFFTIGAKLTAAFTCTSLPLPIFTLLFSDVVVVSDLN